MTTEAVVNCHERGLGRNHRWEGGGVCVRCGADRDQQIASALASGMPVAQVAESVGLARRSVWRAAERVRKGERLLTPEERSQRTSEGKNTNPAMMRAVVAALEERRVRPVGQRARQQASARCPRCGGTVLAERDEEGVLDPVCVACGRRASALTPEEAAALLRADEAAEASRMNSLGRRSNGPRRRGMVL